MLDNIYVYFISPPPPVTVWVTGTGAGWGQLVQEGWIFYRPLNSDYTPSFLLITDLCLLHFNRLEPRRWSFLNVWWRSFTLLVLLIKYSGEKKTPTQQHRHIVWMMQRRRFMQMEWTTCYTAVVISVVRWTDATSCTQQVLGRTVDADRVCSIHVEHTGTKFFLFISQTYSNNNLVCLNLFTFHGSLPVISSLCTWIIQSYRSCYVIVLNKHICIPAAILNEELFWKVSENTAKICIKKYLSCLWTNCIIPCYIK